MRDIENPMVIESLWRDSERETKVVGECAGCEEDIKSTDEWLEFSAEKVLVHDNESCCHQFLREVSIQKSFEQ